jgi:hypothetical protein
MGYATDGGFSIPWVARLVAGRSFIHFVSLNS